MHDILISSKRFMHAEFLLLIKNRYSPRINISINSILAQRASVSICIIVGYHQSGLCNQKLHYVRERPFNLKGGGGGMVFF
jgi:hypothetical protein